MFEPELSQLQERHLLRRMSSVESAQGPHAVIKGRQVLVMCSNDYLGLATRRELCQAACTAIERFGFGSGASRLVSGTSAVHEELERRIAAFKETEAALLFNTGYAANTGIIPAVSGEGDVILSDRLNHASIIDGCRMSRSRVLVYNHRDVSHAEDLLRENRNARRKLIVSESVFSMDGDIAPLPELSALADKYEAMLMIDDAHATGVLGRNGKGSAEHFGLTGRVHIQMGTIGKALGAFGAYVAGTRDLIDYLVNRSRSFIFSTALPPLICAASVAALDIVQQEPQLREKLWQNRERLVNGLLSARINLAPSQTPIIPVLIGDAELAMKLSENLFESGIFATAIRPPAVPEGSARIRLTVTASHTFDDIDRVICTFKKLKQKGLL